MRKFLPHTLLVGVLLGLILATPFLGCSVLKKTIGWVVQRPQVELRQVSVKKASLQGLQLEVALLVNNPNDFSLSLSKLKYNLNINNQQLADGVYDQKITVPADQAIVVNLPITIHQQQSLAIIKQLLQGRSDLLAKWQATAWFASPVGDIELSFSEERPLS